MKQEEMIVLGLAGLAVFFILKGKKPATSSASGSIPTAWTTPNGTSNGWQFFQDGSSIGPDGVMYDAAGNPGPQLGRLL